MRERIKAIRKHMNMTQAEFGTALGLGATSASSWEKKDAQIPTESMQLLICKTFGVNKRWLESGEGDMLAAPAPDPLDELARRYHLSPMSRGIVDGFVQLPPEQRQLFLDIARRLLESGAEAENIASAEAVEAAADEIVEETAENSEKNQLAN